MILARTNMTEMPKRCEDCTYHYYLKSVTNYLTCELSNKQIGDINPPDWCPLVEAKKDEE